MDPSFLVGSVANVDSRVYQLVSSLQFSSLSPNLAAHTFFGERLDVELKGTVNRRYFSSGQMLQLLERLLMVLLEPRTFMLYDLICNCLGAVVLYCEAHGW